MNLKEELLRGIYAYGFEKPSAIQQRAIIPCVKGHDVIAQAQSGMFLSPHLPAPAPKNIICFDISCNVGMERICWQTGHCRVGIIISCFAATVLHLLCDQSGNKRDSVYSEVSPCTPFNTISLRPISIWS
jgi:hypothetical protein